MRRWRFLGRVEPIKGPHLAIEAARLAGRRLVVAGNVPHEHRPWFEATIAPHIDGDRVRYQGPVDDARRARSWALPRPADAGRVGGAVWHRHGRSHGMRDARDRLQPGCRARGDRRRRDRLRRGIRSTEMAAAVARLPGDPRAACRARVETALQRHRRHRGLPAVYAR